MKELFLLFLFLISIQNCNTMEQVKIDSEPDILIQYYSGTAYFYIYNSKNLKAIYFNITDINFNLDNSHIKVCYTDEFPSYSMGFPDYYEDKTISYYQKVDISEKTNFFYKYSSTVSKMYLVIGYTFTEKFGKIKVQASYDDLYEKFTKNDDSSFSSVVVVIIIISSVVVLSIIIFVIVYCCVLKKNVPYETVAYAAPPPPVVVVSPLVNQVIYPINPVYPSI